MLLLLTLPPSSLSSSSYSFVVGADEDTNTATDAAATASVRMMLLINEDDESNESSPLSRSPQRQGLDQPMTDDLHHGDGADREMMNLEVGGGGGVEGMPGTESSSLWMKERAQWDRKMKLLTADNRFLQEEVEKKDGMLGLLTRGLKEVETSQQQVDHAFDTPCFVYLSNLFSLSNLL